MKKRVVIAGAAERFRRYGTAVEGAGGIPSYAAPPMAWEITQSGTGGFPAEPHFPAPQSPDPPTYMATAVSVSAGSDALILPGGGDLEPWRYGQANTASRSLEPERDAWDFALLDAFTHAGKPVLGICRGMQSVNVFFGGTLLQDIPGHDQMDGADRIHAVRTSPGPFAALNAETVNSAHHQAVDRLGDGLRAGQWSHDGIVEAIYHGSLPVWGVQWHPERLGGTGARLFAMFLSLCP